MQPVVSQSPRRSFNLALFCHVLAFAGYIIPLGHIIGPLVLWLVKREEPGVDHHGKEALNFQISITIYTVAAVVLMMLVTFALDFAGFLFIMLAMLALMVFDIVSVVRGAVAAGRGESYRYPLSIRLIK